MWVPSHKGIQDNELVDVAAEAATANPRLKPDFLLTKSDLILFLENHITSHWINLRQNQAPSNQLAQIKPFLFSWSSSHQTHRRHEIFLARFRIA